MTIDWVDIAITILTTGFFSLIGFVWKWSHKVTKMEQTMLDNKRRITSMEHDHDKTMDKIYSINKQRSEFLTRQSFREDSKEIKDALKELHSKQGDSNG